MILKLMTLQQLSDYLALVVFLQKSCKQQNRWIINRLWQQSQRRFLFQ